MRMSNGSNNKNMNVRPSVPTAAEGAEDDDDWETADIEVKSKPPSKTAGPGTGSVGGRGGSKKDTKPLSGGAPSFSPSPSPADSSLGARGSSKNNGAINDRKAGGNGGRKGSGNAATQSRRNRVDTTGGVGEGEEEDEWFRGVKSATNRQIWESANNTAPSVISPTPTLSLASHQNSAAGPGMGGGTSLPPPTIKILRRQDAQGKGSKEGRRGGTNTPPKSMEEREEEYRAARERIFGASAASSSASSPVAAGPGAGGSGNGSGAGHGGPEVPLRGGSGSGSGKGRSRQSSSNTASAPHSGSGGAGGAVGAPGQGQGGWGPLPHQVRGSPSPSGPSPSHTPPPPPPAAGAFATVGRGWISTTSPPPSSVSRQPRGPDAGMGGFGAPPPSAGGNIWGGGGVGGGVLFNPDASYPPPQPHYAPSPVNAPLGSNTWDRGLDGFAQLSMGQPPPPSHGSGGFGAIGSGRSVSAEAGGGGESWSGYPLPGARPPPSERAQAQGQGWNRPPR